MKHKLNNHALFIWSMLIFFLLSRIAPYIADPTPRGYDAGLYIHSMRLFPNLPEWLAGSYHSALFVLTYLFVQWGINPKTMLIPLAILSQGALFTSLYWAMKRIMTKNIALWSVFLLSVSAIQFHAFWYIYIKNAFGLAFLIASLSVMETSPHLFILFATLCPIIHPPTFVLLLVVWIVHILFSKNRGRLLTSMAIILGLSGLFYAPVFYSAIGGLWVSRKKEFAALRPFVSLFLLTSVIILTRSSFYQRYIIAWDIPVIILGGFFLNYLWDTQEVYRNTILFGVCVAIFFLIGFIVKTHSPLLTRQTLKDLSSFQPKSGVILSTAKEDTAWLMGYTSLPVIAWRFGGEDTYWKNDQWKTFLSPTDPSAKEEAPSIDLYAILKGMETLQRKLKFFLGFLVFANFFFFRAFGPTAFAFSVIGFIIFLIGALTPHKIKLNKLPLLVGYLIFEAVYLGSLIVTANATVNSVGTIAIAGSLLLLSYILIHGLSFFSGVYELFISPFVLFISWVIASLRGLLLIFTPVDRRLLSTAVDHLFGTKKLSSLIIGLCIGIPIAGFIGYMLSFADPIFANMTKNFFPKEFFSRLPLRIFLTFQLWVFLFPLLLVKSYSIPNPFQYISKRSWVTEMSVVLALVSLIVGTFLIIQWPYVFARVALESDLSRFGVATYSEYVRRGFQELIFIAVFLYVLVWAGHLALRIKKERDKTILPVVQVLVLGELLLLIVSVFRRIWLYQMHHGWSLMRVYGGFFLMWMLGMVVILSLRHIFKIRWIVVESLFTAMVIGLFVWIPSEQIFILAHPPTVNNRVDYVYLSRLSPDGYEGWIKAFTWAESVVAKNNHGQALSKEDRRDVAYAGDIIEQISKRYHILIRTYGNKEQKSRYVISVYEFQLKQLEKTMQSELLSKQQQVKDATALHAWLGERLQKPVAEANASELIRNITFSTHFGPASKGDIFYTGKPENLMSFYTIRQQPSWPLQDYTQLDRIFMWNKSQTQALQRIMTDIPIERLIAVHDAFISLYQQILTQPNNSYDADVSYDTPLLESL